MKHKLVSTLLAITLLCSGAAVMQTGVVPSEDETLTVVESLSNYSLGSMSWGVKKMGLDKLQKKLEASAEELPEVRVAVIDTGVTTTNKYLEGRLTDDGYNFYDNNSDVSDAQFHGTVVAGIIADGTTSNVKLLPLKVSGKDGTGPLKNTREAIYYAIEHGADVINLSLSANDPKHSITTLDDAIAAAQEKGIVVIAAAGNQSGDVADRYPANKDNVMVIGATRPSNRISSYSNTGATVDFALPGIGILSPARNSVRVSAGTSMAAPHAAAAAALLKTWNKDLNQEQIEEILKEYAVDLGDEGYDETYGWGMIDLSNFKVSEEETPAPKTCLLKELNTLIKNRIKTRFGSVK